MSILLSAYYPEGIVFVADRNITVVKHIESRTKKYVESTDPKVFSWPRNKAIVGYVGLANLAGYNIDEWFRIFIAGTRDFEDISSLAEELRDQIQKDFSEDFSSCEVSDKQLIIHLGGFMKKEDVFVPVLFHIWNYSGIVNPKTGEYPPGERIFNLNEDIERDFLKWPSPEDYPKKIRNRLQGMVDQRRYLWYNNGYNLGAFNVFKEFVWQALHIIQDNGFAPTTSGINARVAFCKMSVELFGSYFTHHYDHEERVVGGGADAMYIPWPQQMD
jgi:hypothetical protein